MEQAKARADTHRGDKGGDAAHACLAMIGAAASLAEFVSDQPTGVRAAGRPRDWRPCRRSINGRRASDEPAAIIEQFLNVRTGEAGEGGMRRDADQPLFKDVVEGTARHKDELEKTVSGALAEDWTWGRIDRLVRAILLAGAYELIASPRRAAQGGDQRICRDRACLLRPARVDLRELGARSRGAPGTRDRARAVAEMAPPADR